jgi:hypothetical protein
MRTPDITATSMIAWSPPWLISPRACRRARCGALELDGSARPSKVADRAVDASFSMYANANPPSQKSLTQKFGHSR